jgi:hypothetical protein
LTFYEFINIQCSTFLIRLEDSLLRLGGISYEVSYEREPLAASVQSDRKRNSGSYLSALFVGQGASEASSLTNKYLYLASPEDFQVTPTAQPNLQAVHGFGQAQSHTKFHTRTDRITPPEL